VSVLVADASVPFDYSILPASIVAVAGYLGGATYHTWTPGEVAQVQSTGRRWWGIWTAPQRRLSRKDGLDDATGTISALLARRYNKTDPVFYDVERSAWDADPAGAIAAITQWRSALRAEGWMLAYPYCPTGAGENWLPHWTGSTPPAIPPGSIGVQFEGLAADGRYDLSIFSQTLWDAHRDTNGAPAMPIDPDLRALLVGQHHEVREWITQYGLAAYDGQATNRPHPAGQVHIKADTENILAVVSKLSTAGVDADAFAQAVAAHLATTLPSAVVRALSLQLAKP